VVIHLLRKLKYQAHRRWDESLHWRAWLGSFGLPHHVHGIDPRPFSFARQPSRSSQWILDLSAGVALLEGPLAPVRLVGYAYYKPQHGLASVEAWTLIGNRSLSQCPEFRMDQQWQLLRELREAKPERLIDTPTLLLRHVNSHFGHFVVEMLGQLLWGAELLSSTPSLAGVELAVFAPSGSWQEFLRQLCPSAPWRFYDPACLLEGPLRFRQPLVAPRLSPWQSLAIARNTIASHLARPADAGSMAGPERLLLSSSPPLSRIANFEPVCDALQQRGFQLANPLQLPVGELFRQLAGAEQLVSEQGSVFLNALLCRQAPTLVLSSRVPPGVDPVLFFCRGGIYNEVARGNHRELICEPVNYDHYQHPYSQRIQVDIQNMLLVLDRFYPASQLIG
jgi:hypothetical protein